MAPRKKAAPDTAATDGASAEPMTVEVMELDQSVLRFWLVGLTPIYLNRKHEAIQLSLLAPGGKLSAVEKASRLKHDPIAEYRNSPYTIATDTAPTYLGLRAVAVKKAIAEAAIDLPGLKKAQVSRLVQVPGRLLSLYGVPRIALDDVRMADIARTPDVRTRAVIEAWAAPVEIHFMQPLIKPKALTRLLAAAGRIQGIGDWRTQKGGGDFGSFRLANDDDPELQMIVATGGRAAQQAAMHDPEPANIESESLLRAFFAEMRRREAKNVTPWPRLQEEEDEVRAA